MQISTRNKSLKAALESDRDCLRHYGADMCKKLKLRFASLKAAVSLADFWPANSGPERCHELKAQQAGIFSMDLKQPYRLLFSPVEESLPEDRTDERTRWSNIKTIELLTVEDTHG